jgi:hypothetical protein
MHLDLDLEWKNIGSLCLIVSSISLITAVLKADLLLSYFPSTFVIHLLSDSQTFGKVENTEAPTL